MPIVYLDRDTLGLVEDTYGLTVTTVVVKPKSRGYVRLRSADPGRHAAGLAQPARSDPDDMRDDDRRPALLPARPSRPARSPSASSAIAHPRPRRSQRRGDHDALPPLRENQLPPGGTCRMGADGDPMAVLDSRLRVRGIENLRVCDLSAMPNINAGNTNAPAMMLGSRCAEFITY